MTPLEGRRPRLRTMVLAATGAVVVAVTLVRVPLATVFTLGMLLVCPLLMIGMHGGGHGDHASTDETPGHSDNLEGDEERRLPSAMHPPRLGSAQSARHQHREVQ